jgi:hypothetical protein
MSLRGLSWRRDAGLPGLKARAPCDWQDHTAAPGPTAAGRMKSLDAHDRHRITLTHCLTEGRPAVTESPAQRALSAATIALALAIGGIAMFLPPLNQQTLTSPLRIVVTALALAAALLLHFIFVGMAAYRMHRSVAGWTTFSVLLCPIGGVAALILLNWLGDEASGPLVPARP